MKDMQSCNSALRCMHGNDIENEIRLKVYIQYVCLLKNVTDKITFD